MKWLLLLSLASFCLGKLYVRRMADGKIGYGSDGEIVTNKTPRDCVALWQDENTLPIMFVYNSVKKTCTPLKSVSGTKEAMYGEEGYMIDQSERLCQKNITGTFQYLLCQPQLFLPKFRNVDKTTSSTN
uniref:Secreted protein n=1 Tax=Steinernema glaseri TaxID=37863 RepID=A0A1I7XYJ8_9BILA